MNYVSCHDNHTLIDKIALSLPNASKEEWIRSNNLAAAIYMFSQGIPFIHAGEEILRSKVNEQGDYVENSYNWPDSVNHIDWSVLEKKEYQKNLEYYKGLIQIRKKYASLRYMSAAEVKQHVHIIKPQVKNVIVAEVCDAEKKEELVLIFNPNRKEAAVAVTEAKWSVLVKNEQVDVNGLEIISGGNISIASISAMVLAKCAN